MSDHRYRMAQREWESVADYTSWTTYLRESRRVGKPIFTYDGLYTALIRDASLPAIDRGFTLLDYTDTEDGFIASVQLAPNPPIEKTFRYPVGPGDYDHESFPIWDCWSGTIKLCWTEDFEPSCPGLEINVTFIYQGAEYTQQHLGVYVYEQDCVTNQEQLDEALLYWDWQYEG